MTYIIAEPCIDIKDRSCVDVCPVDCIHEFGRMTIASGAVARITALSQGLPHYTHLLTQLAAQSALDDRRVHVGMGVGLDRKSTRLNSSH